MSKQHDVIIIGAGPGGSSAAYFLAKKGIDVLLLDRATFPRDKTCGDGLTPRCVAMLDEIGVLSEVEKVSHHINSARIFSPNGKSVETKLKPHGKFPDYMLVSPRYLLDNILCQQAIKHGAHFEGDTKVIDIQQRDDGVTVIAKQQQKEILFQAKIAIIATGASLSLLKKTGFIEAIPTPIIAARAYYEGVRGISDSFDFHFDGVDLPGYGWVFPLGEGRANIGLGYIANGKNRKTRNIKKMLRDFVELPAFDKMLSSATPTTEFKSYPIRTDFSTAKTYHKRTILIGEAAGLVNPLTGEGIDYALESGKIAAQHAENWLKDDDFSNACLAEYDQALRDQYQLLFDFCEKIIGCCIRPFTLNLMILAATHSSEIRRSLTDIILGNRAPATEPTAWNMTKKAIRALVKR
jgi:geranylgeranyl reductase family protein